MRENQPEILVSVIIPVYNTQKELPKCIESVLQQTYSCLEIILVDDGSTDSSGKICEEYKIQDSRIRVIHKKNGGNTSARKAGIKIARGEYVTFVDSDDWVEAEMYEKLIRCAQKSNADVVCSGYVVENGKSIFKILDGISSGIYEKEKNFDIIIKNLIYVEESEARGVSMSLWNKIFRRSIIVQEMREISNDIQILEDALIVYKVIMKSKKLYFSDDCFYHYCMRNGSILHSKDEDYFIKINYVYKELKKEFESYPEYANSLMPQLGKLMVDYLMKGVNYLFDFGVKVSVPYYLCQLDTIPAGSKIVLYGAGKLGCSYYAQLRQNNTYRIIAWIDQNAQEKQREGMDVWPLEKLYSIEFDYILLGVQKKGTAENMKNELMKMGIEKRRIIWHEPESIVRIEKL